MSGARRSNSGRTIKLRSSRRRVATIKASVTDSRNLAVDPQNSGLRPGPEKKLVPAEIVPVPSVREAALAEGEEPGEISDELWKLLVLVPEHIGQKLVAHPEINDLVEIVLDLGRRPLARFPSGDWYVSESKVTAQDLQHAISMTGEFGDDNRAGIDRTLHRVSAMRTRSGSVVGLTCRVGRAISGSAEMVRDLIASSSSLLLMGPPGVGKTTAIREIARMLADEYHKRVVIVDTSNEIAGDGDIPHAGIGMARRMQVPKVDLQHKVMIEAVENHMPQVIVIDEIGTELEAVAAGTIAQRGVQLVGTAHGMTVENLIKNPSLQNLAGGIQSVTLGDEEARRRRVQKSVLERQGPPVFTSACEMISRTEWRVHRSLAATVDALLAGKSPRVEVRKMNENGQVVVGNLAEYPSPSRPGSSTSGSSSSYDLDWTDNYEEDDYAGGDTGAENAAVQAWERSDAPILLYLHEVTEESLEQVMDVMGLENTVQITEDIGAADAVLALRSKLKLNSWVRGMAKFRQLPIFVIKANTMAQMVRAMRAIMSMESLGNNSLGSNRLRGDDGEKSESIIHRQPNSAEEIDALEEARVAVEQIVIPKVQAVELLPRSPEVLALQVKLVESYQLAWEKTGSGMNKRLRILPKQLVARSRNSRGSDQEADEEASDIEDEEFDSDVEDLGVSIAGGTSPGRLPILPD